MEKRKIQVGARTSGRVRRLRCSYCGGRMFRPIKVGGRLCCKRCDEYMKEKKNG